MKVEHQPQQKKEYSINLHLLLKGLHKEFPEKDKTLKYWSLSNEATDSGSGRKKNKQKKTNPECSMKMLHHVCLIPFCIIDMNYWYDSCKVFFKQLNNLLLSMLPQRVPDLDKKLNFPPPFFFLFLWDSQWVTGLSPLSPHRKRLVMCCGPRWRNRIWSWAEKGPLRYWSSCGRPHKWKCSHTRVTTRKVCRPTCNFKCFFVQCEIS